MPGLPTAIRPPDAASAGRRLFLSFRLDAERYVLDVRDIVKVLALRQIKTIPRAPDWVAGLLSYRGAPVPVIDLRHLALDTPSRMQASTRLVLVHYRRPGQDTPHTLGLILENVMQTAYYDTSAFVHGGLDAAEARYLGPVMQQPGGMVQWVRVNDILPEAVHAMLFANQDTAS